MLPNSLFDGVDVHMYGIMIATGILCCFWVLFTFSRLKGIPTRYVDFVFYNGICSIVVGFLGSALWQGIFNYIKDLKEYGTATFSLTGGITAMGGLISGALCFIVICLAFRKQYPFTITRIVSIAPICMSVAHAFGRMGCFFAGCCYGKEATGFFSFLGVVFKPGSAAYREFGATPIYPTQLFEAIFLFALTGVMSFLLLKKNFHYNFVLYMAAYGVWRFFIEFVRADERGSFIGSISPSQALSIGVVLLAIPAFFLFRYLKQRFDAQNNLGSESGGEEITIEDKTQTEA